MGTEPLFDDVITPQALTTAVINAKKNLSDIGVQVTVSELAYGYQVRNASGSQAVLDAIDVINAHMLPFFAGDATRGAYFFPHAQIVQEMSDVSFRSECVAGRSQRLAILYQPRFGKEDILGRGSVTSRIVQYLSPFLTNKMHP
jgi:hypothetical protein